MNLLSRVIDFVSNPMSNAGNLHKCIMRDDTMAGVIEPGSEVIVDVSAINFYEDGIYLFNYDGVLNIKRLQFLKNGIKVIPNNGHYISYLIEDGFEKLVILGRVVSTRRMECWA
ncbi:hypothetical protein GC087_21495 [Pantoea sp. JZ2]|uniref:S24 family peptidase n=1 Tax=Pantoea sp. JZ2 TaxID=2654189 RepID=UPI002B459272|nr:S24 family peptidase [Pantoea sp. JZ2]WRH14985.1 hypothetical protein GC087_21495 [Pantoea sp. JZ2]